MHKEVCKRRVRIIAKNSNNNPLYITFQQFYFPPTRRCKEVYREVCKEVYREVCTEVYREVHKEVWERRVRIIAKISDNNATK